MVQEKNQVNHVHLDDFDDNLEESSSLFDYRYRVELKKILTIRCSSFLFHMSISRISVHTSLTVPR